METRQRGGNRKERMDGGGEEGRGKKERGESGLDCKWDSTSTFTRKINMRGLHAQASVGETRSQAPIKVCMCVLSMLFQLTSLATGPLAFLFEWQIRSLQPAGSLSFERAATPL